MGPKAKEAIPALIESLYDRSKKVRRLAAKALIRMGKHAVPALKKALEEEYKLKYQVAIALGKIGPKGLPALLKALSKKDKRIKAYVAEALTLLGAKAEKAIPKLLEHFALNKHT